MPSSIVDLISDFSGPAASEGFGIATLRRVRQAAEPDTAPIPNAADRQAELMQSFEAQVRAEEREVAREQLARALKTEQDRQREELAVQREIWIEQEARQVASQIINAIDDLESLLSERAARILASVIPEALRQNAITEFNKALSAILAGDVSPLLKVTGPEDLLKGIRDGLVLRDRVVEFVPSDIVEVTLVAGDTTIQTQLGPWVDKLQALLKAGQSC